ncbi:MAG TPA: Flp family type IVb pilin [Phycisphaerae bacterium]|nr:Flp family type IVb pilin [Phycisphaerales bacterium]HNO79618.1 Flp family type IVb pilin [Phycisphaerae bacterium]
MRRAITNQVLRFIHEEDGPTATEYAVMFAMILLVCIAAVKTLGTKVSGKFVVAEQGW